MAKAKVKLVGAVSYNDRRGRTWKKDAPRIITDDADIRYFQSCSEFTVTMLEAPKPVKPEPEPEPEADDEAEVEGPKVYTEADLKKQSKTALVDLAAMEFNLDLDADMSKPKMITAILEAQEKGVED